VVQGSGDRSSLWWVKTGLRAVLLTSNFEHIFHISRIFARVPSGAHAEKEDGVARSARAGIHYYIIIGLVMSFGSYQSNVASQLNFSVSTLVN